MRLFLLLLAVAGCDRSADAGVKPAPVLDGETLYMRNCAACHQMTGEGIDGAYPSLVRPSAGTKAQQIELVVYGRRIMPPNHGLTDAQIAAVMTYINTAWGNTREPVREDEVARVRRP